MMNAETNRHNSKSLQQKIDEPVIVPPELELTIDQAKTIIAALLNNIRPPICKEGLFYEGSDIAVANNTDDKRRGNKLKIERSKTTFGWVLKL